MNSSLKLFLLTLLISSIISSAFSQDEEAFEGEGDADDSLTPDDANAENEEYPAIDPEPEQGGTDGADTEGDGDGAGTEGDGDGAGTEGDGDGAGTEGDGDGADPGETETEPNDGEGDGVDPDAGGSEAETEPGGAGIETISETDGKRVPDKSCKRTKLIVRNLKNIRLRNIVTKTCISRKGDAIVTADCSIHDGQFWNLEKPKWVSGKSWFRLIANDSSNKCLEDSDNNVALEPCEPKRKQQLWSVLSEAKGHFSFMSYKTCNCISRKENEGLVIEDCNLDSETDTDVYVIETFQTVPCKKSLRDMSKAAKKSLKPKNGAKSKKRKTRSVILRSMEIIPV